MSDLARRPLAHYSGPTMFAVATGLMTEPRKPYTHDAKGITSKQYDAVIAWAARNRGMDVRLMAPEEPEQDHDV